MTAAVTKLRAVSVERLVEPATERALVAALIASPTLHESVPDVGLDVLTDFHATHAFEAFTRVRERGEVTPAAVRAQIESAIRFKRGAMGEATDGIDLAWFDALVFDAKPVELVRGWARRVIELARKRCEAVNADDERLRTEDELDDVALRDVEPVVPLQAEPDPWEREIGAALADVQRSLGVVVAKREPLFTDAVGLLSQEFPLAVWAVTGLITRGGIAMFGGEPKTIKTWSALEVALAVATGTKACREFFAEAGTAAYFFAEDQDKQVRNRIRALLAGSDRTLQPGRLHVCPRGKFLDVTKDADLAWIVASCRRLGRIDLLALDPLRDISSAAEDKSDEMAPVMRRLRLLAELLSCTVVVVHHAGKATADTSKRRPGQRLRGSSAIHGSTDSGIYFGNLDGDGANVFRNVVDSEVKGARSAGRFELSLSIEDNADGEAMRAVWSVTRSQKPGKSTDRDQADDDAIFAFVRGLAMRGEYRSRTGLRDHDERPATVPYKRVVPALDRLLEARRLVLVGAVVRLPELSPNRGES